MFFPFEESKEGLTLKLDVVPKAGKFEIAGFGGTGSLKIKVKSPPEKGKANEEIVKQLSRRFCAKAEVMAGKFSRKKKILLRGNPQKIASKIISTLQ
jgi:uncharacterized protein (TIGR00251 family)